MLSEKWKWADQILTRVLSRKYATPMADLNIDDLMRGYTDQNNEELFVVMNLEIDRWVLDLVHDIIFVV